MRFCLTVFACLLVGCGGAVDGLRSDPFAENAALRLRHQIMFDRAGDVQVFEGYMITTGEAFLIKAFAGPGIDLFTIVRNGASHVEKLHITGLEDRIDIARVGADIARVYLGGCPGESEQIRTCSLNHEKMIEHRDEAGNLRQRQFPEAHGIGLVVRYEDYRDWGGHLLPTRITLSWKGSPNRMVIRLVACDSISDVDQSLFAVDAARLK